MAVNPVRRRHRSVSRIRQSQADLRFLTEAELAETAVGLAGPDGDLQRANPGSGSVWQPRWSTSVMVCD